LFHKFESASVNRATPSVKFQPPGYFTTFSVREGTWKSVRRQELLLTMDFSSPEGTNWTSYSEAKGEPWGIPLGNASSSA
jgi:hypothetical protein